MMPSNLCIPPQTPFCIVPSEVTCARLTLSWHKLVSGAHTRGDKHGHLHRHTQSHEDEHDRETIFYHHSLRECCNPTSFPGSKYIETLSHHDPHYRREHVHTHTHTLSFSLKLSATTTPKEMSTQSLINTHTQSTLSLS